MDQRTDGRTDRHTLFKRCVVASKNEYKVHWIETGPPAIQILPSFNLFLTLLAKYFELNFLLKKIIVSFYQILPEH